MTYLSCFFFSFHLYSYDINLDHRAGHLGYMKLFDTVNFSAESAFLDDLVFNVILFNLCYLFMFC